MVRTGLSSTNTQRSNKKPYTLFDRVASIDDDVKVPSSMDTNNRLDALAPLPESELEGEGEGEGKQRQFCVTVL